MLVTYTTRPRRKREPKNVYPFISDEEFKEKAKSGFVAEYFGVNVMYSTSTGAVWTSTLTTSTSGWYWYGFNRMDGSIWACCSTVESDKPIHKKEIKKTQALDDFLDSFQKQ